MWATVQHEVLGNANNYFEVNRRLRGGSLCELHTLKRVNEMPCGHFERVTPLVWHNVFKSMIITSYREVRNLNVYSQKWTKKQNTAESEYRLSFMSPFFTR